MTSIREREIGFSGAAPRDERGDGPALPAELKDFDAIAVLGCLGVGEAGAGLDADQFQSEAAGLVVGPVGALGPIESGLAVGDILPADGNLPGVGATQSFTVSDLIATPPADFLDLHLLDQCQYFEAKVANDGRSVDVGVEDYQTYVHAPQQFEWALRSKTAGKVLYVTKIWMQLWFDGTGAATEMKYEWIKGTACTAMSGGDAVTALLKKTAITNADVDARVLDTGITQTGISQGAAFFNCAWARLTHSATQAGGISLPFVLDFGATPLELAKDEVLSLRQVATSVIGDSVGGGVEFFG